MSADFNAQLRIGRLVNLFDRVDYWTFIFAVIQVRDSSVVLLELFLRFDQLLVLLLNYGVLLLRLSVCLVLLIIPNTLIVHEFVIDGSLPISSRTMITRLVVKHFPTSINLYENAFI